MSSDESAQYSRSFCDAAVANAYESFYQRGTADEAIWSIEREFLANFYSHNESLWPQCSYLDFACGTGRIIAFMEEKVSTSTGIDISPEMLKIARTKVHRSNFVCADVTTNGPLEEGYDLITAFRFFLNAEPDLRSLAIHALAQRLKNENSRLVLSNHGNPWSYKALMWPFHRARQILYGRQPAGNYLTHREVKELIEKAGLQIVERFACGLISGKLFRFAPSLARAVERFLAGSSIARVFGVNQIYVLARS